MRRITVVLLAATLAVIALGVTAGTAHADIELPAKQWYAVVWNRTTDTLHWVNDVAEVASMPRPQLPNEGNTGADLYISPNGRYMMLIAGLQNQNNGVGFYDLQTGEWLQTHEAQPGEQIIFAERNPFSHNSEMVAIGFASDVGWRVIAFDPTTGDFIDQLTNDNPLLANLPQSAQPPPQGVPSVSMISLEEGQADWRVHIRFVTLGPQPDGVLQPEVIWSPNLDTVTVGSMNPLALNFEVLPLQNRLLFTQRDGNDPAMTRLNYQVIGFQASGLYEQAGAFIEKPRWVANGLYIAFRMQSGAQVPMWNLSSFATLSPVPFAPDYDELLGTFDGFLLVDYEGGEIKFANTFVFEAFTPTLGNTVFTTDTSNFRVAYITPQGIQHTLTTIAETGAGVSAVDGPGLIAPPQIDCGVAPPARLSVNGSARVTFTDGTALNVRTAPGGEFLMQIPEGFTVQVVDGPVCQNDFLWWDLRFESEGVTVGGWAAEGDNEDYYLEPITVNEVAPPAVAPTNPPRAEATNPPRAVDPTRPPRAGIPGDGDCSNAPVAVDVAMGEFAHTNTTGTLPLRAEITDLIPTWQVPDNVTVNITDGPVCNGGFRLWRVSLTLNGQSVQGWLADGSGQNRYLIPGPARAGS